MSWRRAAGLPGTSWAGNTVVQAPRAVSSTVGANAAVGPAGATGPQGYTTWHFTPPKRGGYEHQFTGRRQFCVRVTVMQLGEAVLALATRIHRNTREFEWQEADRKHRMAVLENGCLGVCKVADEGTRWCRGWKSEDRAALQAASALANT